MHRLSASPDQKDRCPFDRWKPEIGFPRSAPATTRGIRPARIRKNRAKFSRLSVSSSIRRMLADSRRTLASRIELRSASRMSSLRIRVRFSGRRKDQVARPRFVRITTSILASGRNGRARFRFPTVCGPNHSKRSANGSAGHSGGLVSLPWELGAIRTPGREFDIRERKSFSTRAITDFAS